MLRNNQNILNKNRVGKISSEPLVTEELNRHEQSIIKDKAPNGGGAICNSKFNQNGFKAFSSSLRKNLQSAKSTNEKYWQQNQRTVDDAGQNYI